MHLAARPAWRNQGVLISSLLLVIAASWAYMLAGAGMSQDMGEMLMPVTPSSWSPGHAGAIFIMWSVMMAAMMLPSATPMFLFYATITQRRRSRGESGGSPAVFVLGYIAIWVTFSLAATTLQFVLESASLLSGMMAATSVYIAGAVMIGAGIYQWTTLKQTCLQHCRSPLEFVLSRWREGTRGAFFMGLQHGAYCLGCCWMLMLLLFVGGVMNLAWIAGLTLVVLVEKLAPYGHMSRRITGALLLAWGLLILLVAEPSILL